MGKTTFLSLRYIDRSDIYDKLGKSHEMTMYVMLIENEHFIMMLG